MKIYLNVGDIIGSQGYTDVQVTKTGLKLFSTEGAELGFYDNDTDTYHKVKYDMDDKVNGKKNPNFGKLYYEKD